MAKRDYYQVLGVGRDADADQIKKAYRKLALRYHPDRNPGDNGAEEKFKEATEAYEVLRDPERRSQYDRFGHAGVGRGGQGFGPGGFEFDLSDALRAFMRDFGGFGGGLDDLFGFGGRSRRRRARGEDLQVRLRLDLREIARGVEKTLKVKRMVACEECEGSGARRGSNVSSCSACGGRGEVRQVQRTVFGQVVNVTTCPRCHGEGSLVTEPCERCRGDGRIAGTEKIRVKVPAGVTQGNYITVRGKGNAAPSGGPPGDLFVVIEEKEDPVFTRRGDDVILDLPLTISQLALGTKVEIPTLRGKVSFKVPPGTQSHKIFRIKASGLPRLDAYGRGDQLVRVLAWTPQKPSRREKQLLEELEEAASGRPPSPGRSPYEREE
jgi:molecular chaperone DnaJ